VSCPDEKEDGMMWWWNDYWPMHWVFGPLTMILFIAFCGAVMFFMMRGMAGGHGGRSESRRALEILKERFARGEISQTQYEEQRRLLKA
jgi:putative membrane protein